MKEMKTKREKLGLTDYSPKKIKIAELFGNR